MSSLLSLNKFVEFETTNTILQIVLRKRVKVRKV
jgi:hypothetical protein